MDAPLEVLELDPVPWLLLLELDPLFRLMPPLVLDPVVRFDVPVEVPLLVLFVLELLEVPVSLLVLMPDVLDVSDVSSFCVCVCVCCAVDLDASALDLLPQPTRGAAPKHRVSAMARALLVVLAFMSRFLSRSCRMPYCVRHLER